MNNTARLTCTISRQRLDKMELKKYKLADIAKIEISGVDKKTIEGETPVRLCNFVDVYYNWAITKEKAKSFMVASAKQTEIDKCSIGKDMVAITKDSETRDDIGIATYIADDFEDVLLGYHCALITPNPAIVDGKYLNAFMHTRYIQKYFENNASGSGQRYTLSNDTISNIPVLLPSIEEQHTIGKLLADLDRKIELNKQINDNLPMLDRSLKGARVRLAAQLASLSQTTIQPAAFVFSLSSNHISVQRLVHRLL